MFEEIVDKIHEIDLADGKTYKVVFTTNAFVEMEKVDASGPIGYNRALLWAGMREYHPALTLEDVGRLMPLPRLKAIDAFLAQAVSEAMGTESKKEEEGPMPQEQTGP